MYLKYLIILLLIFSCNSAEKDNLSIFKYNDASGITSLDPAFSKNLSNVWATSQIYDGLVKFDENLKIKPAISKYWKISKDGKKYTFILRSDVYFHEHFILDADERNVKAEDFVYSFSRIINDELASPGSWVMNNVDTFYSHNDSTLVIQLKSSFPPFLGMLTMPYFSVVSKKIVENFSFREYAIGTGPFKFQYWKDNVKLVLRKNNDYYESNYPKLDAISISFIRDKQSAFLSFLKGDLDFISGIDGSYKDEVLTVDGNLKEEYSNVINLQSSPYLNTEYLGFLVDSSKSVYQNKLIRKAVNFGFDRVKMIKYLRNNIGTPAIHGFIPKGMPSYDNNLIGYSYDPLKAKNLLEKANISGDINLVLSTTSSYLDLCEYIQGQLSELGIKLKIDVNPPSAHRQLVATSKLNFFRGSWIADYADAENYLALFYSKNFSPIGPNYTHFNNEKFDALYEKSIKENNDSVRNLLYKEMDRIIIEEAIIVPLYYDKVLRFVSPRIKNFNINPMNNLDLTYTEKN